MQTKRCKIQKFQILLLVIIFHSTLFLSFKTAASGPISLAEALSGAACRVDVNLSCRPPTANPAGMIGTTWSAHTLKERIALYLSDEVQDSKENCEKFALLMKTECKIPMPVVSLFYNPVDKLSETHIVVGFNTNLDNNNSNLDSFGNYFANRKNISCLGHLNTGDRLICATSLSNPKWRLSGPLSSHYNNTELTQFNNQSLIAIDNLPSGLYNIETSSNNSWPSGGEAEHEWINDLPTIILECHLINSNTKIFCTTAREGDVNFLFTSLEWFINGTPLPPICKNAMTCSIGNLPAGKYYIQVIAKSSRNVFIKSNIPSVNIPKAGVRATNSFAVSVHAYTAKNLNHNKFTANWGRVSGALGYKLSVSTSHSFATFIPGYHDLNVGSDLDYEVRGLTPNTTYYYRVTAFNNSGGQSFSNIVLTTTDLAGSTSVMTSSFDSVVADGFTLHWSAVSGTERYRVTIYTSNIFMPIDSFTVARNVLSKRFSGLRPNTTYNYSIEAISDLGNQLAQSPGTIAGKPIAKEASNITADSFTANWDVVNSAQDYIISVSQTSTFSSYVAGYNNLEVHNTLEKKITGLRPNTVYYYRVSAIVSNPRGFVHSLNSNVATLTTATSTSNRTTTAVTSVPNIPTATAPTEIDPNGFTAHWNAVNGATNYLLTVKMRYSVNSNSYNSIYEDLNVGNLLSLKITGLTAFGKLYSYRVKAVNSKGISANSNTIETRLLEINSFLAAPVASAATHITNNSFTANWSAMNGADIYEICYSTNIDLYPSICKFADFDVTNLQIEGLAANTTYYYKVGYRKANALNPSYSSNRISFKTLPGSNGSGMCPNRNLCLHTSQFGLKYPQNTNLAGVVPGYTRDKGYCAAAASALAFSYMRDEFQDQSGQIHSSILQNFPESDIPHAIKYAGDIVKTNWTNGGTSSENFSEAYRTIATDIHTNFRLSHPNLDHAITTNSIVSNFVNSKPMEIISLGNSAGNHPVVISGIENNLIQVWDPWNRTFDVQINNGKVTLVGAANSSIVGTAPNEELTAYDLLQVALPTYSVNSMETEYINTSHELVFKGVSSGYHSSNRTVTGWACIQNSTESVSVDIKAVRGSTVVTLGTTTANLPSGAGINGAQYCNNETPHNWSFTLTQNQLSSYQGWTIKIYIRKRTQASSADFELTNVSSEGHVHVIPTGQTQ